MSVGEQDRQLGMVDDVMGDAAEDALAQTCVAVAAHDQKIGADRLCLMHQGCADRFAGRLDDMGFAADPMPGEIVLHPVECIGI